MTFHHFVCLPVVCSLVLTVHAEIFTLKDGTSLEGTILRQDDTSYVLEVQVARSIKDERIIAKEDVVKVQRTRPDVIAFRSIDELANIPDMLSEEQYAQRIRTVEKFLQDHRGSDKSADARAILASHKAELEQIAAGGIKVDGMIVSPADYRANALDIDAAVAATQIRALLGGGFYLGALRKFSAFDADFRNTKDHSALVPLIMQAIRNYTSDIELELAGYEKRMTKRLAELDRMQIDERRITEAALKEQNAEFEARFKSEKEARIGWVSTDPNFKPSLEESLSFSKQETSRLSKLSSMPQPDAGKAYREALQKIRNAGTSAEISAALSEARSASVPPKYFTTLETTAASATKALAPK